MNNHQFSENLDANKYRNGKNSIELECSNNLWFQTGSPYGSTKMNVVSTAKEPYHIL